MKRVGHSSPAASQFRRAFACAGGVTDRGVQYASIAYLARLNERKIAVSMSRPANPGRRRRGLPCLPQRRQRPARPARRTLERLWACRFRLRRGRAASAVRRRLEESTGFNNRDRSAWFVKVKTNLGADFFPCSVDRNSLILGFKFPVPESQFPARPSGYAPSMDVSPPPKGLRRRTGAGAQQGRRRPRPGAQGLQSASWRGIFACASGPLRAVSAGWRSGTPGCGGGRCCLRRTV